MILGLTGKYCSGKNYIAAMLQERGLPVLDVDKLGHSAIENKKTEIIACFGPDIQNGDGSICRKLLGKKVFGKADKLAALETIVHPEANRLTDQWLKAQNGKNCVINAALLHKSSVFEDLDCIILVKAPWFTRLIRAKRRDKLPLPEIIRRMASQKQFNAQYSAKNADIYKVENSCLAKKGIEQKIDAIFKKAGLEDRTTQGGF